MIRRVDVVSFDDPAGEPQDPRVVTDALVRALAAYPVEMAQMIEELHRRVHDETSLLDLMRRASAEAVRLVVDVHWAGVTAQFHHTPFTVAHTDERVLVVDEGQYGQGDGPCLQAIRVGESVAMTLSDVEAHWPLLAATAGSIGVRSFLALPLHDTTSSVGSLNLYSAHDGGLRNPDPDLLVVLSEYLSRGLQDYLASRPDQLQAERLRRALDDQALVSSAIGLLMIVENVGADEARALLQARADRAGLSLAAVSAALLALHDGGAQ